MSFLQDVRGDQYSEVALLLAFVVIAAIAAWQGLGGAITAKVSEAAAKITGR